MTISSTTRKAGPFTGTGSTGPYSFTFKVFQASDLLVVKLDVATNVETTLTLTTDYTVSLNADQNSNPGGSVTLVSALAVGKKMVISSQVPYLQPTDLTNQGGFYPEVITDALDRLTIEAQQLNEGLSRAALLPITSAADAAALVADIERLASSANNLDIDANNIGAINTVATNITNVNTVATNIASVNAVAGNTTNINAVNANATNINAVNANSANINTVAGNNANVTTVAGISANVTSVAGNATNINAVAGNATNINAVNANKTNIDAVAGNNSNITAVAGNATNINAVNANAVNINAVNANSANINAVNLNKTNIDTVAAANTAVTTVSTNIAAVNSAYTNLAAIQAAPTQAANAATSATNAANSATAAAGSASSTAALLATFRAVFLGSFASDANAVSFATANGIAITDGIMYENNVSDKFRIYNGTAWQDYDSSAQASQSAAALSAANAATSASNAATSATNAATSASTATSQASAASSSASAAASSATAAAGSATSAAGSWTTFHDQYQGAYATAPSVRPSGGALQLGDLYFNTTSNSMQVRGSSGWTNAGSSVNGTAQRYRYIATAGQTTFTGTDSNGNTLTYDAGYIDVYMNGVRLDQTDITATSGTSIVLASAAALNDEINIVCFGTFSVASFNGSGLIDSTVNISKLNASGTRSATTFLAGDNTFKTVAVTPTAISDQANASTGYMMMPVGTTAQRPGTPATGMFRHNTSGNIGPEWWDSGSSSWVPFGNGVPYTIEFLVVAGGGGAGG